MFLMLLIGQRIINYPLNLRLVNRPTNVQYSESNLMLQHNSVQIQDVITCERNKIKKEMMLFDYPAGRNIQPAKQLSDLTLETGGIPIRSVVITTWRSGSTFFGDIINSLPANYYHYEPLSNLEIIQIRNESDFRATLALSNIKKFLQCDYSDMESYIKLANKRPIFLYNKRLWRVCKLYPKFCYRPDFLTSHCRLFPLQSMKIVRLRLSLAGKLLDDSQ
ncbi:uncharacterized protein DMENIID0001_114720 [Sergentomyia squamirostris]